MFAVIHLPDFAMQAALRHEPDWRGRPMALVDTALVKPLVIQMTAAAGAAGVTPGLTPVQVLARCRDVAIRHRSPAQEASATEAVLQVAFGFSPNLENTAPGIVTLDLRGLSELTDDTTATAGETTPASAPAAAATRRLNEWAARLQAGVAALQLHARIGIGPTPGVARHAAHWAGAQNSSARDTGSGEAGCNVDIPVIVQDAADFIARLPVDALGPSAHVADILHRWGIGSVGEFLALGQAEVTERLGLEAFGLFAAASTRECRPLHLVRPAERFEEAFEFELPVETMEPLLFLLRRFVDQLSPRLEVFGLAAGLLTLRLRLESGGAIERRLRVPQPTRSADILYRMLNTHLENLRTDAPIVAVALVVEPVRPEQKQFSLFEAALRDPHQFQETLARLSALVGAERVGTPIRGPSHRPDAFKLVPPDFENAAGPSALHLTELLRPTPIRRLRPPIPAVINSSERSRGTATPGPAESVERESRPGSLHCALGNGSLRVVLGPWRRSGEWWEPTAWQRTEWEVETVSGQTLRVVQQRDGAWFVEGVLD